MEEIIRLDPVYTGHHIEIEFEQFEDDACTIPDNYTGQCSITLYRDSEHRNLAMKFTEGSGLTKAANKLTVFRSKTQNTLTAGLHYGAIDVEIDSERSRPLVNNFILPVENGRVI